MVTDRPHEISNAETDRKRIVMLLPYADVPNSRSIAWVRSLESKGFDDRPVEVWLTRPRRRPSFLVKWKIKDSPKLSVNEVTYPDIFQYPGPADFAFSTSVLCLALASRGAIDICVSTDLRSGVCALVLKALGVAWNWCHDDQDYAAVYSRGTVTRLMSKTLESAIVRRSDLVTSVSYTLESIRKRQGARRTAMFPNGVYPSPTSTGKSETRDRHSVAYMGSLGAPWGVDLAVKAISLLPRDKEYSLVVIGGGPEIRELSALADALGISGRVSFLGAKNPIEAKHILAKCSIGLAPYNRLSGAVFGVPLKIKEYLSIGMLVVSTSIGEIPSFLKETNGGVCAPEDAKQIARAIETISEASDTPSRIAKAREYVNRKYSWESIFRRQEKYILEILG